MAKITTRKGPSQNRETIHVSTKQKSDTDIIRPLKWWNAANKTDLGQQLLSTATFLKDGNNFRYRQNAIYARMYSNMPLFGFAGSNLSRINTTNQLPIDRPTMSVVSSCIDTLVSRLSQSRPRPVFLTDGADYKKRNLAKQLNSFTAGEFFQTKAYELGPLILRDALVLGTGVIKILEDLEGKVRLERRLCTTLLVDGNDAVDGEPRQFYEMRLVDRDVLNETFEGKTSLIANSEQAYMDSSGEAAKTVSDQILIIEGWHLPSGPNSDDGAHAVVCSEGLLFQEKFTKDKFPFVYLHYSPRMVGFWGQSLCETLMGTQMEINKLLMTIANSINLVGVPKVFVEEGSKVVKAHLNNDVGSIVTYRGTPPSYQVPPCVPMEMYQQLDRLVNFAYQQSGISQMAASSQKPQGLTSGAALREYDDLQTDRFAFFQRRYDQMFLDLAYQIIDLARDIAERDGSYQTVYPNKDGTREVKLPDVDILKDDPFIIQCFDASALPRDPAGRLQQVTELMQASIITPQEGRRLLDYPDIEQVDKLANSGEERILQSLDKIVEDGVFVPPDAWTDLTLAMTLATQYINLYGTTDLEEEKMQLLRDWFSQVQQLIQTQAMNQQRSQQMQAQQVAAAQVKGKVQQLQTLHQEHLAAQTKVQNVTAHAQAQAVPQGRPVSDLLSNVPQQGNNQ